MLDSNVVMGILFFGAGIMVIGYYFNRTPGMRNISVPRPILAHHSASINRVRATEPFSKEPFSYPNFARWNQWKSPRA